MNTSSVTALSSLATLTALSFCTGSASCECVDCVSKIPATIRTPLVPVVPAVTKAIKPFMPSKRPRPIIRRIDNDAELAWAPEASALYSVVDGENVRAGESFSIVRPDWHRWPFGIATDHYRVVNHNETKRQILEGAGDRVTCVGALQAGHGYHVAHFYDVKHMRADSIEGAPLKSGLVVAHDHTGKGALRARMVVYVGKDAVGSVIGARGLHRARHPELWRSEIEAMVEKATLAQDCILEILKAAKARKLDDTDREWLAEQGIVSKKGKNAATLFDAMIAWFQGNSTASKMTWGVWERRLDDTAFVVMCEMLGRADFGTPLDSVLGVKRFGKGLRRLADGSIADARGNVTTAR